MRKPLSTKKHAQFLSDRKTQKKSRKIHVGATEEKKENGNSLKILDLSLIEKNACFSSVLHPMKSLAAGNHEILNPADSNSHNST